MSNVVRMQTLEPARPRDFSPSQLSLIRRTVAADCNTDEFDLFVEVAKRVGLDPFRRQIYAVVYNKNDDAKRKMSIITGIDGFRAVAARNRDYRPDDQEPTFEIDENLKGPPNPMGLIRAVVRAFKLAPDNQWHPVVGVAYWSEFAPMKTEGAFRWEDTGEKWPDTGKPKKRKVPLGEGVEVPSGKWGEMPFVMLAKCAEAQALRKGWPEDLSGVYTPEEMERPMVDITPSAEIEQHEQEKRLLRIGAANTAPIVWKLGEPVEQVPVGELHDRIEKFAIMVESPAELEHWRATNQVGLNQYWGYAKSDALDAKRIIEERIATLRKAD
jgi:phage recombination protein Bet